MVYTDRVLREERMRLRLAALSLACLLPAAFAARADGPVVQDRTQQESAERPDEPAPPLPPSAHQGISDREHAEQREPIEVDGKLVCPEGSAAAVDESGAPLKAFGGAPVCRVQRKFIK